jgi:nicotinate phosphoribosyltransferase
MQDVAKKSKDKLSVGGRKWAMRRRDESGVAQAEIIGIGEAPRDDGDDRPLMIDLVRGGEVVDHQDIHEARERHAASRAELPRSATQLSRGEPVIPTIYEED